MVYTKRFAFLLIALLLPVTLLMAQDPATTETPVPPAPSSTTIPAQGQSTSQSAAPGLPTPDTVATLAGLPTAQPAPGATPGTGQPPAETTPQGNAPNALELPARRGDLCPALVLDSGPATAL